jgi:hypothetical protein|tara:strand:+ start:559 stop:882 length:324 start_codon:yes stop_codon:yes gene_type:complete|mmetsp:Transcript_10329/g.28844  ORF Transcript_10329/g.28844 Transcript_10329/m.28844 type:complete len:108 (-) Transcript_10329:4616-4939(-)
MDFPESASDSHAFPHKSLQRVLSHLIHARNFNDVYVHASDEVAAAMYSLKSRHALTWRLISAHSSRPSKPEPFFAGMRQASLPMPNLKHAYNNEITTTCCTKHRLAL